MKTAAIIMAIGAWAFACAAVRSANDRHRSMAGEAYITAIIITVLAGIICKFVT